MHPAEQTPLSVETDATWPQNAPKNVGVAQDTLRFSTAGSVDDGKSTLIGRLLHDVNGILDDQLLSLSNASKRRGHNADGEGQAIDFSLLTDGLIAEREQGITIDVAYRYFTTLKRRFIIADTPGHAQYTRNMVTGASTADLTIVLVDAKRGLTEQSHRHVVLAALLGIPHLVVAVNKMDLINYDEAIFTEIEKSFGQFIKKLNFAHVNVVPICATKGEMLANRGQSMPWYRGQTLLEILETTHVNSGTDSAAAPLRFAVQRVAHKKFGPNEDKRGYQGMVASGQLAVGDEVTVMPVNMPAVVEAIYTLKPAASMVSTTPSATAGEAITLVLDRQLDVSRGDMFIASAKSLPKLASDAKLKPYTSSQFSANLCWFDPSMLDFQKRYWIKHSTKLSRAVVDSIDFKLNVETLAEEISSSAVMNDIVRVNIQTQQPLVFDLYRDNHETGAFILIDDTTHRTVAGGMIVAASAIDGDDNPLTNPLTNTADN